MKIDHIKAIENVINVLEVSLMNGDVSNSFVLIFSRDEDGSYGYQVYYDADSNFQLYGSSRREGHKTITDASNEARMEFLRSVESDDAKKEIIKMFDNI